MVPGGVVIGAKALSFCFPAALHVPVERDATSQYAFVLQSRWYGHTILTVVVGA